MRGALSIGAEACGCCCCCCCCWSSLLFSKVEVQDDTLLRTSLIWPLSRLAANWIPGEKRVQFTEWRLAHIHSIYGSSALNVSMLCSAWIPDRISVVKQTLSKPCTFCVCVCAYDRSLYSWRQLQWKPYCGHFWDHIEVSWLSRCPFFRGLNFPE